MTNKNKEALEALNELLEIIADGQYMFVGSKIFMCEQKILAALMQNEVTDDKLREAVENIRLDYDLLANEMVFKGNSVQHWHAKATAYKNVVGRLCDIATKHGIKLDGKDACTRLDEHLTLITAATRKPEQQSQETLQEIIKYLYAIENGNANGVSDSERIQIMQGFARDCIRLTAKIIFPCKGDNCVGCYKHDVDFGV